MKRILLLALIFINVTVVAQVQYGGGVNTFTSTANSSTATLTSGSVFTGTSEDVSQYAEIRVYVISDVASATDGLSIQQSNNGTNWDATDVYTISAATGKVFGIGVSAKFFRIVYTNGGTNQASFRLQTIFHKVRTKPASVRSQDAYSNENDLEESLSFGMYWNGTTWDRVRGSAASGLTVALPTGASTAAKQPALGTAGTPSTDVISVQGNTTGTAVNVADGDLFITGQSAQSASGNNAILAVAGTGSTDTRASGQSYRSFYVQVNGTAGIASGGLSFEGSNDNTNFVLLTFYDDAVLAGNVTLGTVSISASTQRFFSGKLQYRYFRIRITPAFVGGTIQCYTLLSSLDYVPRANFVTNPNTASNLLATININAGQTLATVTTVSTVTTLSTLTTLANGQTAHSSASTGSPVRVGGRIVPTSAATQDATLVAGDAANMGITTGGQLVQKPYESAENDWTYAAATGGISNTTTAVTFKAASGTANIRNYITGIQIYGEALGAATEIAIRDGAAGTVLWRGKIGTGGMALTHISFTTPLRGSSNTLLEVVTLTASITGAVFFDAQGYQGF